MGSPIECSALSLQFFNREIQKNSSERGNVFNEKCVGSTSSHTNIKKIKTEFGWYCLLNK